MTAVATPSPGAGKKMLCGSPGSRFSSGSNRFSPCPGAAADVRVVRSLCRAVRAVVMTVIARYLNSQLHVTRVLRCRSHAHSAASVSRGESVKIRRALLTLAGGAAAALIAASPALAAGTWQVDSSPNPAGSTFSQLNSTFAASHTQAWAVGQTRVAASGDGFEALIEEWNGSTWSVVPGAPASVSASSLNGVSGSGPSDIWAVGQNAGTSFIEHWNGQSWSQVASPASEPPDGQLNAVSADSPTDAWAGGSAMNVNSLVTPLIEHWNGTQWSVSPGAINNGRILSIAATSPADAWALTVAGKGSPAVIEHWNGSTWSIVSLPVTATLHGLSAVSANDVWAVGNDGVILNWNGTQWSQVANPAGQGTSLDAVD